MRTVQKLVRRKAPHGPSKVVARHDQGLRRRLQRLPEAHRPTAADPTCRGKRWVRPITALDMYRRIYQLGLRASSGNFRNEIVAAEPPSGSASAARAVDPQAFNRRLGPESLGSNGLGIGRDGANGERALLLSNTHFPWQGSERWYEVHLTIPGKLNVIGAALQGVPVVNLGFTRGVAWSHTVSTARRFTPYELDLRRGPPDRVRGRRPQREDAQAHGARAGARRRAPRTRSTRRAGGRCSRSSWPGLTWGTEHAYALADVNADNFRLVNQWEQYDRAQSVARPPARQPPRAGQPVDEHDRRRLGRQRLLLRRVGGPERRRRPAVALLLGQSDRAGPALAGRGAARRLAQRAAAGRTTATRSPRASSARAACRARRARTTWRTPTTPTGCRARASGSTASRASSAARARSGCCARGSR